MTRTEPAADHLAALIQHTAALRAAAERLDQNVPDPGERAAEIERVARQTVNAVLATAETTAQTATTSVRRDELRRRALLGSFTALAVLTLVIVAAVITFDATLDRENRDITRCFLSSGRVAPADVAYCGTRFEGYAAQQKRSADAIGQFNALLKEIPRNRDRIEQLEREVARLGGKRVSPTAPSVPSHKEPQ